jgi:hypothetical protein
VRQRPTRANIERELVRLASAAARGDHVLVFFAGHGSQQPDADGDETDDGLDEIFLPRDVDKWDATGEGVINAISDDEIGRRLTAIRNTGAFVWAVFDACQSSTLTRGEISIERHRMVPMDELVPAAAVARVRAGARGSPPAGSAMAGLDANAGGMAALYAAQTSEPTPEKALPEPGSTTHGLFTYSIVKVLEQAATPISYRDLIGRVVDSYRAQGRVGPTPAFEGGGLDQEIVGLRAVSARSRMLLEAREDGGIQLRAGSIHGLTRGTILRLFPPAGSVNPNTPLGYLRVAAVAADMSALEPIAFNGMRPPAASMLVPGARADVAAYDYGDQVLKIGVIDGSAILSAAVAALPKTTSGLASGSSVADADWIARVSDGRVSLSLASGSQVDVAAVDSPTLSSDVADVVARISRARNLLRLAAEPAPAQSTVDIEIDLVRYRGDSDQTGAVVPLEAGGRTLRPGDDIVFRLRNTGTAAADVTLLFIDSEYGITAIFPRGDAEADSRLARGAEAVTEKFTINDTTLGWEQVVAIAVEARNPRVDFRHLEQMSLTTTRSVEPARRAAASGLQRLLDRAMFGQGTTRSLAANDVGRHAIKMLAWKTIR